MSRNIKIITETHFLLDQSSEAQSNYVWSYDITIENHSDEIIQLLNRAWKITDMRGQVDEIKGPGVIGLQPIIKPHKSFSYSSFCQLNTPQGSMEGTYEMQNLDDEVFEVLVPKFLLQTPQGKTHPLRSLLH